MVEEGSLSAVTSPAARRAPPADALRGAGRGGGGGRGGATYGRDMVLSEYSQ